MLNRRGFFATIAAAFGARYVPAARRPDRMAHPAGLYYNKQALAMLKTKFTYSDRSNVFTARDLTTEPKKIQFFRYSNGGTPPTSTTS